MFCSINRLSIAGWLYFVVLVSLPALGQIGPSIKPKDGKYDICLKEGTTRHVVTILLDVPVGSACVLKNFRIDWGDNQVQQEVYDPSKLEFTHEYDVKEFVENCRNDADRSIKFRQTDNCGTGTPANSSFDITFRNTPRPKFEVGAICAGQRLNFQNQTCPASGTNTYLWNYGDNSPPDALGTHTYAQSGTYTATLSVTGTCAPSTPYSAPVRVIDKAIAAIRDSGSTTTRNDTVFICLSAGNGTVRFNGTSSTNASSYTWDISGPALVSFQERTNRSSPNPKVRFTQPGDYIVTLTVDNACGIPNRVRCVHRVLDLPTPTLKKQSDTCEAFTFKVDSPLAGATYTLNGVPFNPTVGVPLSLTPTPYVVAVTTQNICGSQPVSMSFTVNKPAEVKITSLPKSSTVCANSAALPLLADQPGGSWSITSGASGIRLGVQNGQTTLVPGGTGTVRVSYRVGNGRCAVSDFVDLTVTGVGVTVNGLTACASQNRVKLPGSPSGGTWSTTDCNNCIRGDSLLLTNLTASRVTITYQVSSSGGCQESARFSVSIGQPKSAFALTGQCTNRPVTVVNSSTGADSYSWLVNGVEKATGQTPTPALSLSAGPQTVTLRASAGGCSNETQQTITLTAPPAPFRLQPSKTADCSPMVVTFGVNRAAQPGITYRWDYGDGVTSTSLTASTYTYRNQGQTTRTFTATLTASNGCGTEIDTARLTVRPLAFAEIGVDSTTVRCTPATLRFSNRSVGEGQVSTWNFDDGTTRQTQQDTVLHRFLASDSARTYRVTLRVQNACGTATDTVAIRVYPTIVKPLFTLSSDKPCAREAVQFTDATVPRPTSWIWTFSDGATYTTPNPVHRFAEANRVYSFTLTAITPCGSNSLPRSLTTTAPPDVRFEVPKPFVCNLQEAQFVNRSDPARRFRWSFGDGSPIDSVNFSPRHVFPPTLTNATVSLTVLGASSGCSATLAQGVTIQPPLKPTFSVADGPDFCVPGPVALVATDPNARQFRWELSNGLTSTAARPIFGDLRPGEYGLKLTVGYEQGACPDSASAANVFRLLLCQAVAPDAFTPNSDGRSDTWTLFGDEGATQIKRLRIWNRWGEVVFEAYDIPLNSAKPGECWDGNRGNTPMPAGQYPYEAEVLLKGDKYQRYTGSIALMR
ncbi:PKD domain-containing protein [Spirosoma montaniterrae]|uniref:PKD domain-containing protein n=1 Tax=Spirosoma montaniterrae TaxID=1178516 RepID=A0A1P9WTW7_9BACT|nr:PKD domain-containing protein [Spirosoma montaniterrae]AQG78780.1 hypothetical protein AWR27_05230 [Spirosoma montaniterrae]